MPKKTKREKILARARRIIWEQSSNLPNIPTATAKQGFAAAHSVNPYSFKPVSVPAVPYKHTDDDLREFTAIRSDLIKTIILSAAAVIIEIILYSSVFKK